MKMNWRAIASSLIAIAFGFTLGLSFAAWRRPPLPRPPLQAPGRPGAVEHFVDRFATRFDLTAEQKARALDIVAERGKEMDSLRNEVRPRYEALRMKARADLRDILNPEQRLEYDQASQAAFARRRAAGAGARPGRLTPPRPPL